MRPHPRRQPDLERRGRAGRRGQQRRRHRPGSLNIEAERIEFGYGPYTQPVGGLDQARLTLGFANVNLRASDRITANHRGSLNVYQTRGAYDSAGGWHSGGTLNLLTPLLTGEAGSVNRIKAGDAINLAMPAGAQAGAIRGLGAELDWTRASSTSTAASPCLRAGGAARRPGAGPDRPGAAGPGGPARAVRGADQIQLGRRSHPGKPPRRHHPGRRQRHRPVCPLQPRRPPDGHRAGSRRGPRRPARPHPGQRLGRLRDRRLARAVCPGRRRHPRPAAGFHRAEPAPERGLGLRRAQLPDQARRPDHRRRSPRPRSQYSVDAGSLTVAGRIDASGVSVGSIRLSARDGLRLASNAVLDAHGHAARRQLRPDHRRAQPRHRRTQGRPGHAAPGRRRAHRPARRQRRPAPGRQAARHAGTERAAPERRAAATSTSRRAARWTSEARAASPSTASGSTAAPPRHRNHCRGKLSDHRPGLPGPPARRQPRLHHPGAGQRQPGRRQAGRPAPYADALHLRPGIEIRSATPDGDLVVQGDLDLSRYRYASLNPHTR